MMRIILPSALFIVCMLLLPTPVIAQSDECPGSPSNYLHIGATATPNDVILGMVASPNGNWLYQVEFGETVTVVDGPVCANGRWWLVQTADGRQGWVKDGISTMPWLVVTSGGVVPGDVTPNPPLPADPLACSGAPANFLSVGVTAWVIPNSTPNNVRSGPGTGYNVIVQAAPGIPFTIIDGPVCAENFRWWQIRMQDGSVGWTPDGTGSTRWLENGGYGGAVPPPVPTSTSPPTWTPVPISTATAQPLPTWTSYPSQTPVPLQTSTLPPSPTSLPQPPSGSIAVNNRTSRDLCEVRVSGSNVRPWYADPILPGTLSEPVSLPSGVPHEIEVYACDGTLVASFPDFVVSTDVQHNLQVGDDFPNTEGYITIINWQYSPAICGVYVDGVNRLTNIPTAADSQTEPIPVAGNMQHTIEVVDCEGNLMETFTELIEADMQHNFPVGSPWPPIRFDRVTATSLATTIRFVEMTVQQFAQGQTFFLVAWPVDESGNRLHAYLYDFDPVGQQLTDPNGNLWFWNPYTIGDQGGEYTWSFEIPLHQFPEGEYTIDLELSAQYLDTSDAGHQLDDLNFLIKRPALNAVVREHSCETWDVDCDGLNNDLEHWIAQTFALVYYLDVEEQVQTFAHPFQVTSDVTCVTPELNQIDAEIVRPGGDDILLTVVFAWERDYVEYRTWSSAAMQALDRSVLGLFWDTIKSGWSVFTTGSFEGSFSAGSPQEFFWTYISPINPSDFDADSWTNRKDFVHFGDTERVRICIRMTEAFASNPVFGANWSPQLGTGRPRFYQAMGVEFRRHGHTFIYLPAQMSWEETSHPVIFVSEGKHGQYVTLDECGSYAWAANAIGAFWDEDCSHDPGYRLVAPLDPEFNVGERAHPIPAAQAAIYRLFPGEGAWREWPFCGGHLVANPQTMADYIGALGTGENICGGSLSSKWWPPLSD